LHKPEQNEKDKFYSFWNTWLDMKEEIKRAYQRKDPSVAALMKKALENYSLMLESFLIDNPSDPSGSISLIEPLNGKERLHFIHMKIASHFAYVQLNALYTEAMKKAVSRLAMKK
jgi:hypothetical protein